MSWVERTQEMPAVAKRHTSKHAGLYAIAALVTALGAALPSVLGFWTADREHEAHIEAQLAYLMCAQNAYWMGANPNVAQVLCAAPLDAAARRELFEMIERARQAVGVPDEGGAP